MRLIVPFEPDSNLVCLVFILRHTLMNPFPMVGPGEHSYIDMYLGLPGRGLDAALGE